jgi:hypothetical protein
VGCIKDLNALTEHELLVWLSGLVNGLGVDLLSGWDGRAILHFAEEHLHTLELALVDKFRFKEPHAHSIAYVLKKLLAPRRKAPSCMFAPILSDWSLLAFILTLPVRLLAYLILLCPVAVLLVLSSAIQIRSFRSIPRHRCERCSWRGFSRLAPPSTEGPVRQRGGLSKTRGRET